MPCGDKVQPFPGWLFFVQRHMKNQTQKTATASPKARRKSETLTLGAEARLAFNQVVARFHGEELAIYNGKETRDAHSMALLRRSLGNTLLALACEAVMEKAGSIHTGSAWWKLILAQMSDEEIAAKEGNNILDGEHLKAYRRLY